MRITIAFLVVLVSSTPVMADPGDRAEAVVGALGVDAMTTNKLRDVVFRYDLDLARLERKRVELRRLLVEAHADDPKTVEVVLDDLVVNQRALARNEEALITRLRQLLPPKKAAQLLVLLAATEPPRATSIVHSVDTTIDMEEPATAPRRDDRSPPRSLQRDQSTCNPFDSMHGCPMWRR